MLNTSPRKKLPLKQFYGKDGHQIDHNTIWRSTYGYSSVPSCIGIDPQKFVTKPYCNLMSEIANEIMNILQDNKHHIGLSNMNLEHKFNSCTLLLYCPGCKMGFHTDTKYGKSGLVHTLQWSSTKSSH